MASSQSPKVKVLDRQFSLLKLFLSNHASWSLAELVRASGLPKSTVHRLVSVLCQHELLWQDPQNERYRLGGFAVRVGQHALAQRDLRRVAWPILNRLASELGETGILATLNAARDQAVYVEQIESRQGVRLVPQIGVQLPLHAGGVAKAILAHLDDEEIDRLLSQPLERLARGTKTDPEALRQEIYEIRKLGYALSFEETYDGAAGMAVPVFDHNGRILASIGMAGPISRVSPPKGWTRPMQDAARCLEAALGGRGADIPAAGAPSEFAESTARDATSATKIRDVENVG